jgi:hypothetical protein
MGPAGDPALLITTSCVLHAGGGERSSNTDGVITRANCWFNAECMTVPGEAHPGDGFVDLECKLSACRCEWRMAHANHPGGDEMTLSSSFTIPSPCVGDMARDLLVERCIRGAGLKLHGDSP